MSTFDPTLTSLKPALKLLRHDWVQKFFFETPKTHRLSQLNYALNNPITLSGKLNVSSISNFQFHTQTDFLFAPSFTTGRLTVGFDITDRHTTLYPLRSEKSLSWAVRDDDEGVFLSVSEHPSCGLTELSWCTKITPGCKCLVFVLIKTSAFRHIIQHGFDENIVTKNLLYSFYSLDIKSCPSCGSHSFMNCSCRLSLGRKKHPNDYDGELRLFDSYVGAFDGFASLRNYHEGRVVLVANCLSTIVSSVVGDMGWKQRVSKWALGETAQNCSVNIPKLSMPAPESEPGSERLNSNSITFHRASDDVGLQVVSSGSGTTGASYDEEVMTLLSYLQDAENNETSDDISACGITTSIFSASGNTVSATNIACSEKLPSSDEAVEVIPTGQLMHEPRSEHQHQSEVPLWRGSSSQEPNAATANQIRRNRTTTGPSINIQPTGTIMPAYGVEHNMTRRPVPLAPSDGFASTRPSTFTSELERKAEVRKARNRASALRSNEKKRIYLKQLKQDIAAAGEREAMLREKEKSLREENVKLRASIYR